MTIRVRDAIVVVLGALSGLGAARVPQITDLREIPLHMGVNDIARLAPDGRDGIIVEGEHSDSPTADGRSIDFMALLRDSPPGPLWEVVDAREEPSDISDRPFGGSLLSAAPHDGEDWKRNIAFARGRVDGSPALLLIVGERDLQATHAANAHTAVPADITVYRMQRDDLDQQDHFIPIQHRRTMACYVDVRLAVAQTLKLPLPTGYAGPGTPAPCGATG
jgi:hypothetical protein